MRDVTFPGLQELSCENVECSVVFSSILEQLVLIEPLGSISICSQKDD